MAESAVDYTKLFRDLAEVDVRSDLPDRALRDRFVDREAFDAWLADYIAGRKQKREAEAKRAE